MVAKLVQGLLCQMEFTIFFRHQHKHTASCSSDDLHRQLVLVHFTRNFIFLHCWKWKSCLMSKKKIRKLLNNNSHSRLQPNASSTQWISTWSKAVRFASCGLSAIHRFANLGLGTFSSRTWTRLSTTRPCTTHSRLSATFWAARWHRTKLAHQKATDLCTSKLRSRQICPSTKSMVSEWLLLPLSWQHMVYVEIRMLCFVEIWRFYSLVSFF